MMMNERVVVGGDGRTTGGVDEKLVALHRRLKRIAKARAHLDLAEAEALREAQRLQLWRQFGHTSLADYMVNELGYSSHKVAEDRLRVANALPTLPALTAAIQNGTVNFSQAKELVRVATPETEKVWIEKAQDMNVREVEQAVAGHVKGDLPDDPIDPRLVRKTIWLSVRPETEVLFREVKQALDRERGEKLDEDAVLEAICRAYLSTRASRSTAAPSANGTSANRMSVNGTSATATVAVTGGGACANEEATIGEATIGEATIGEATIGEATIGEATIDASGSDTVENEATSRPRGPELSSTIAGAAPYRVAITVCRECKRGWQHGAGRVEEMTPAAVERAQCDAQHIGDLDTNVVERARQEVSVAMRRKVLHRDQNRCRVPGCLSHTNLDVHHIQHVAHGGKNELPNLITLCEAHHLALHDGTLAIEGDANDEIRCRREGRNNFTRATREMRTRQALRERGYDREQVKEVMRRTVSHVGSSDLSEEQWLAIALRYAAKPST